MDYLYSKRDLENWDKQDIDILTNYYDINTDNRQDLLWLLAISILSGSKYAQMPPAKVWDKYHKQLLEKFAKDSSAPKEATELPKEMISADPSPNKKYLEWIIKSYLDNGIKLFEDLSRTKTALQEYSYLIQKKLITNKFELDINAFCGLAGCRGRKKEKIGLDKFLDRYSDKLTEIRKEVEYKVAEKDVNRFYEDEDLLIVTPLTEEASCKYGAGTKWCTAAREDNLYKRYAKEGPLYILIPKKPRREKEKYQMQLESSMITDEMDEIVDWTVVMERFPTIKNIAKFKQMEFREAAEKGNTALVKELLQNPNVDSAYTDAVALRMASENGHIGVVKLLLADSRIDPSVRESAALWRAAEGGHTQIVELLLADGHSKPKALDNAALRHASENGHADIVQLLLNYEKWWEKKMKEEGKDDEDPRYYDYTNWEDNLSQALIKASENGHTKVVELLLQDGRADPSESKNKAIREASKNGHPEIVKLLLKDSRVDPSDGYRGDENEAIIVAIRRKDDIIRDLLWTDKRVREKLQKRMQK